MSVNRRLSREPAVWFFYLWAGSRDNNRISLCDRESLSLVLSVVLSLAGEKETAGAGPKIRDNRQCPACDSFFLVVHRLKKDRGSRWTTKHKRTIDRPAISLFLCVPADQSFFCLSTLQFSYDKVDRPPVRTRAIRRETGQPP